MSSRVFTLGDQMGFGDLSGDNNPLHMDPIAARRCIFGAPVVHGIHSLLWALDQWLEKRMAPLNLRSLKVYFLKPILLQQEVHYSVAAEQPHETLIELSSGGSVCTRIRAEWQEATNPHANSRHVERCFPQQRALHALSEEEIQRAAGVLNLCVELEAAVKMFPDLMRCISPLQVAVILCTSRLVGVECPGLHSVYSELDLHASNSNNCAGLDYEVTKFERRFGCVYIKIVAPGMAGSIKAFVRPQPQQQAQYLSLKHLIEANEFTGQRALVVGGSRGLGEVAAKILCSGGAQVKITYYQGKDDANRIVDEITSNGGAAGSFHLDVLNPGLNFSEAGLNGWNPTHLYYFATPFISAALKGAFSPALFTKFCNYYVAGFLHTVQPLQRRGLRNIFYPSTVFIDDPPANMGEYAAAKMAGEMVCRFLQKNYAGMTIHVPRLPRMATDQTVSLWPSNNLDPVTVMIEALRRFQDKSASTRR